MVTYIALLRKETGSDYGVSFPDFPGCVTAGRTLEEARRLAAEALAFHVEVCLPEMSSVTI
jgi:predicted RNase H-like HicB family nuclease